jgi:hypothetical protein
MNMTIRFKSGQPGGADRAEIARLLAGTLERFARRLKQVHVYIEDTNGPRGGVDKHCRCVLHLKRRPPIVIDDRDESVGAMIHRVADRAAYALCQQTQRLVQRGRFSDRQRRTGRSVR